MSLNSNLKKFRKNKGLTQKELAEKSGITRESIGNYERGDRIPPANILSKIAIALGVSINDLIDYESYIDKSDKQINSQVLKDIDSSFKKMGDISSDNAFNHYIDLIFTDQSFKVILLDLITKEIFRKEFHLDTLDLTDSDKETIVNDIYQYTQFICSKIINSKKNNK